MARARFDDRSALRWALAALLSTGLFIEPLHGQATRPDKPVEHAPPANDQQQKVIIPLAHGGDRLFVKVRVNDQDVGWWLLDTGESGIVIDAAIAKRLALPVVSKIWGAGRDDPEASLVLLGKLEVEPAPAVRHLAVAADLSQWRPPVDVEITGILGWAFLRDRPFSIDFRAGTLTLFPPGVLSISGKPTYEGALRFPAGVPEIQGDIAGLYTGWFRIESGEEFPLLLDSWFIALHPELASRAPPLGGLSEYEQAWSWRLGPLHALGKSRAVAATLWMNASQKLPPRQLYLSMAHVGAPFLRDLRLSFDPASSRVWAERLPDEPVDAMLMRLGDPKGKDLVGNTPLMQAAGEGRADAVAALIDRGAEANAAGDGGHTPLMHACEAGNAAAVKALLANGASPNAPDVTGFTALTYAAVRGDLECVKTLLAARAQVDRPDSVGVTPLFWAAAADREQVAELLMSHGAQPGSATQSGNSPLLIASELDNLGTLRVLLKAGIPAPNPKTGRTLLMEAAAHNAIDATRELIRNGVGVNVRAADGKTALMEAAGQGASDVVRLLLAAGADLTLRSAEGRDAFDYAMRSQRQYCMLLLYAATHRTALASSEPSSRPSRVVIPAQRGGPFLCLPARIDGQPPVPMILDTGSIGLVIDKSMATKLHLRKIGQATAGSGLQKTAAADVVEVPRLEIGGFSFGPTLCFATDLSGIAKSMGLRVPFTLGMPFIDSTIKIDFPAAKVEISDHKVFEPPDGLVEIPLLNLNSLLCVPAVLFKTDHVMAQIDTGAAYDPVGLTLLGPYPLLHRSELGAQIDSQFMQSIAGSAEAMAFRINAGELLAHQIDDAIATAFTSPPSQFWSVPPSAITATMLQRCTLWLDPAGARAWAQWLPVDEPLEAFLRRTGTERAADLLHTTPLMRAVGERRVDAVEALLKQGANPDDADTANTTALTMAFNRGDQQIADMLLDSHAKATAGALIAAASRGIPEGVGRMIQAANWKHAKPADVFGPLGWAARGNDATCVKLILEAGADPNGKYPSGYTVLDGCALWGSSNSAEVLLKHKADLEVALPNGERALMLAAHGNRVSAVSVFLAHGATVDAVDHNGKTALMYAAANPDFGIVQQLLKAGAKPGLVNQTGGTALDIASQAKVFSNAEAIYFALNPSR